jgi:hypothetical protein
MLNFERIFQHICRKSQQVAKTDELSYSPTYGRKNIARSGNVVACCDLFGKSEKLTAHIFDLRAHKWVCLKMGTPATT